MSRFLRLNSFALFVVVALISTSGSSQAQGCIDPPSGLLCWWPGDTDAQDIYGGNDGVLTNGAQVVAAGYVDNAFSIDGVDDYILVPDNRNIDVGANQDFTVDAWIKVASGDITDQAGFVMGKHSAGNSKGYILGVRGQASGDLEGVVFFDISDGALYYSLSGGDVDDSQWHHIAGVRDGSITKIYIDGQLVASRSATANSLNNNAPLLIGDSYDVMEQYNFKGLIDEVEFCNRALSAPEIEAVFNSGSEGKCKGPREEVEYNSIWLASTGLTPDLLCPTYILVDTADPEDPVLAGGILTISTSTDDHFMFYRQSGSDVTIPDPLVIEMQMRYDSGASYQTHRSPAHMIFETAPFIRNVLFIDQDLIFLNDEDSVRGNSMVVDTDDDFHTYLIEVYGSGAVRVFYDGVFAISGALFYTTNALGTTDIAWGDGTRYAYGTSEWKFVRHNASTVPCGPQTGTIAENVICDVERTGEVIEIRWTLSKMDAGIAFRVLRSGMPFGDFTELPVRGLSAHGRDFVYRDGTFEHGATYRYRVEYIDGANRCVLFETGDITVPALQFALGQNSPNPFNPATSIGYALPVGGHVCLDVYDVTGRHIRTLVDEFRPKGEHTVCWNGVDGTGTSVSSGVYFYTLSTGKQAASCKMVLLR
jgi:hypothetical protein